MTAYFHSGLPAFLPSGERCSDLERSSETDACDHAIFPGLNRFTVAGTVYESHILPYSPAFKPAPATVKEQ
jgi:hypothetical protein